MTIQMDDQLRLNEKMYSILEASDGRSLFNTVDYGFDTYSESSCCWRGYICNFKVEQNNLLLDNLSINSTTKPKINNVKQSIGGI